MAHFKEIIEKYFSQSAGNETKGLFADWLSMPVDAELKDQILQEHWEKEYYLSPEDIDRSYRSVQKRIHSGRSEKVRRVLPWAVAAAFALALVLRLTISTDVQSESPTGTHMLEMTECYVGNGEKQVITLSDSSTVFLNSGTLLIYPKEFTGRNRTVYLSGEAIFDVAKDPAHPFIVSTTDFSVKVHGTLFNVSSYPDAESSTTTLKEGSVSVTAHGMEEYLLSPNQTLSYSKETHKVTVEQASADDAFGWKDGQLCFKSSSIHSIVKSIERYYGVRVYLTTGKYDSELITAKFIHGESVDELFSALSLVIPGLKYKVENNSVYIE